MPQFSHSQFRYLALLTLVWLAVFFVTRNVLLAAHLGDADMTFTAFALLNGIGLLYDFSFLIYACAPLALYLLLCPRPFWRSDWHKGLLHLLFGVSIFAMMFVAVAEWLFWEEFGVRFNFIAVDYLIYSNEVVNNILQSYPVYPLLALLAAVAGLIAFTLRRRIAAALAAPMMPKTHAIPVILIVMAALLLNNVLVGQNFPRDFSDNVYQRELASNGPFQFFAAFRNNELDYRQFYATLPDDEIAGVLRAEIGEPNARFIGVDPLDIRRAITNPGEAKRLNVILVTVESLSAKYLGSFGDERGLTPNLDKLRRDSLFFSNFYATGTRTVRGLEAITLSIPPTPGRSIVKRVGRESGYASLGRQLNVHGYDSVFLYGGRGYFDNMNAFFSGNGYRIVDQSTIPDSEIGFKNAWGMSDEDLYAHTLKVADADHVTGKPFFLHLMTTSNHRPYTYPENRIDIPSGDGRAGAVKYTDYAIGHFLAQARQKPWFDQTLFLFVADHTAGSAGKEDLPVENYHIPLFLYAPALIAPGEITTVASQIDIAPTLLGLLNLDYTSTFFGRDLLRAAAAPGRALIGNYQHLGLFDGENLAILSPKQQTRRYRDARGQRQEIAAAGSDVLLQRNIAYYQGASEAFAQQFIAWTGHTAGDIHLSSR